MSKSLHRPLVLMSVLALMLAMMGVAAPAALAAPDTLDPDGGSVTSSGEQTSGRWQTFEMEIEDATTLEVTANWDGDAVVNLFLRRGEETVAYANSTNADVETLTAEVAPGNYTLAALVSTGTTEYVVSSTVSGSGSVAPAPSPAGNAEAGYPGQPAPGTLYWGASIHGGGDPYVRHERQAGVPMSLRRTFHQWSSRASGMVNTARGDLAEGRLPWVSIKPPSWAAVANGRHDAEIDQMLRALDGLDGPVWLTVNHEPEGGGGVNQPSDPAGPAGHLAMNQRVRDRIDALGVDNVALAPILMAWTFHPLSGRNIEDWWDDGVYDLLGIDIYQHTAGESKITENWLRVRAWAEDAGVDIAVGEWGLRGSDQAAGRAVHEWYDHAARSNRDGRGARVVGLSAFDSGLNAPTGSWELRGPQLEAFRTLMTDPRTASID